MKTVRRFLPLTLAALLLAGPLAAALPDTEMAGADGSVPATAPEKKPTPRSGAAARKHRAGAPRSVRRATARGARRPTELVPRPAGGRQDSSSRPV